MTHSQFVYWRHNSWLERSQEQSQHNRRLKMSENKLNCELKFHEVLFWLNKSLPDCLNNIRIFQNWHFHALQCTVDSLVWWSIPWYQREKCLMKSWQQQLLLNFKLVWFEQKYLPQTMAATTEPSTLVQSQTKTFNKLQGWELQVLN